MKKRKTPDIIDLPVRKSARLDVMFSRGYRMLTASMSSRAGATTTIAAASTSGKGFFTLHNYIIT
jgi:hypothetical protein